MVSQSTKQVPKSLHILIVDRDQRKLNLEELIRKLRTVTLVVQLLPFIYGFLFILALIAYLVLPDWVSILCDHFFYVSLTVILYNLILSRTLRLCHWHRIACIVPLFPEMVSLADLTLINLSSRAAIVNIITIISMTLLLLVAAYNVFFNGRK